MLPLSLSAPQVSEPARGVAPFSCPICDSPLLADQPPGQHRVRRPPGATGWCEVDKIWIDPKAWRDWTMKKADGDADAERAPS